MALGTVVSTGARYTEAQATARLAQARAELDKLIHNDRTLKRRRSLLYEEVNKWKTVVASFS